MAHIENRPPGDPDREAAAMLAQGFVVMASPFTLSQTATAMAHALAAMLVHCTEEQFEHDMRAFAEGVRINRAIMQSPHQGMTN